MEGLINTGVELALTYSQYASEGHGPLVFEGVPEVSINARGVMLSFNSVRTEAEAHEFIGSVLTHSYLSSMVLMTAHVQEVQNDAGEVKYYTPHIHFSFPHGVSHERG